MTVSRKFIKNLSRDQIKGNIGILFVVMLLMSLIISASAFTAVGPILLSAPLTLGVYKIYLGLTDDKKPEIGDLFSGFNSFGQSILLMLKIGIFTFLWSLLFFVPGIIKSLSYSMSYYIMAETPGISSRDALEESKRMTNGHKGEIFVLGLSFFPWILLVCVTVGIAGIYVIPYINTTMANYYRELKKATDTI